MTPFILVPLIFLIAGFLQGLTGFGSAMIAMPLLAFVLDIKTAVAVCTLCGVVINLKMVLNLREKIDLKKVLPLTIGSIPGAIFGTVVVKQVNSDIIMFLLGVLLAGYAAYSLLIKPVILKLHPSWGLLGGFSTGFLTATVSAGGPPAIIYAAVMGWEKDELKSTLAGFFITSATFGAAGHLISGITTFYVFKLFLASLIPVLLGVYLGYSLAGKISDELYKRMVMILLVFMGIMLIFESIG